MAIRQYNSLILIFSLVLLTIGIYSCTGFLEKPQSESQLRAFDNELIRLSDKILETRSYLALKKIKSINNAPVPIIKHESEFDGVPPAFNFEVLKGIYYHDTIFNIFVKKQESDSIIVFYNDAVNPNATVKLIIAEYTEDETSSSFLFPTRLNSVMYIGNREAMKVDHKAKVEHGMPVDIDFNASFDNYNIIANLKTKLRKKTGKLDANFEILRNDEILLNWIVDADLAFAESTTYFINKISMKFELYPIIIDVRVNNKLISKSSNDYVADFNKYSNIRIFSGNSGQKIGDVKLKAKDGSDKLNFVVYYKDGSFVYIDELLLSAKRIMNIKL